MARPVGIQNALSMSLTAQIVPTRIDIIGEELAIAWNDGQESFFTLESLRRACPCAVCQGEADVLGSVERPERTFHSNSFQLKSLHSVGGYAFQLLWHDGHSTGLFSYSYLRQLDSRPGVPADSNLR
jgi:DUF971 family protein